MGIFGDHLVHPSIREFSGHSRGYGAGAFAYALRRKGAARLMDVVVEKGMKQAVDWFLFDQFGDMVSYHLDPMMAMSPHGKDRDSDNDQEYPQVWSLSGQGHHGKDSSHLSLSSCRHDRYGYCCRSTFKKAFPLQVCL